MELHTYKKVLKKFLKSIFVYTCLYTMLFFISQFILNSIGFSYLQWFKYLSYYIIAFGIFASTIQMIIIEAKAKKVKSGISIILIIIEIIAILIMTFFLFPLAIDKETIVDKDGIKMVQQTHENLSNKYINYYKYENPFVRKNVIRIHQQHGNYTHDIKTEYYDQNGNMVDAENGKILLKNNT